jgi:phosphoglycerate dehydrogenase-like enzyme
VTQRPQVIVDPHFRAMDDVFAPADLQRLVDAVDVVWGRDEPMPDDAFRAALPDAFAVVSAGWRYGPVLDVAENLRAILTVSGGWPPELDYGQCFARGIRVLSAAPAFAGAVAEMALGLALACGRDIVGGDRAMRSGEERWLSAGEGLGTFPLAGKRVGFVGFGNIGRVLRDLIAPFRCELVAYDPWLTDAYLRDERVEPIDLPQLLES